MKRVTLAAIAGIMLCSLLAASAASLEVDKTRTKIQVDAKATGHAFTGTLKNYAIKVAGDGEKLKPQVLELSWNFADLDTGDAGRNVEMIKWLGGGTPKGSFKFIKFWADKSGVDKAEGTLTIHGVSKAVSFPFAVRKDGDRITANGRVEMNYKDFDLPVVRAMLVMTVDAKLVVNFQLVGKVK